MNILDIREVLEQKGADFVQKLLDSEITVYEKLDGNAIGFYKNENGRLVFFKKNDKQEISIIDRTVTNLYDKPIGYFENLPKEVIESIPVGYKFGFEYFASHKPLNVEYDNLPKNNLILNYIERGNTKIEELSILEYWSHLLNIEKPAIIFTGFLKDEQKSELLSYVSTPAEMLEDKYKTQSFTVFLINLLNPYLQKTTLNNTLDKVIEGVIIKFKYDNSNYYAKIIDPTFKSIIEDRVDLKQEVSYNYYLILFDILEYVRLADMDIYQINGEDYDTRYLNLMCLLFNDFCNIKGEQYLDMEFALPEYLKPFQFKINKNYITNPNTLHWLDKSENFIELFKIFLASFRKKRKRENHIFDAKINFYFNQAIDKIKEVLSRNINESRIDFEQFVDIYVNGKDSTEVLGYDLEQFLPISQEQADYQKEITFDYQKFFSQVFVTTSKLQSEKKTKKEEQKEEVYVFMDNFSPFNNRHFEYIREINATTGARFVLVHIDFPFKTNSSLLKLSSVMKGLDVLKSEYSAMIKSYITVDDYLLKNFVDEIHKDAKIKGFIVASSYVTIVEKQLQNNVIKNNYLQLDTDNLELKRYEEDLALRSKIKTAVVNNDYPSFKQKVPNAISNMFNLIHTEYVSSENVEF